MDSSRQAGRRNLVRRQRRWGQLTDLRIIVLPSPAFKSVRLLVDPPLAGDWNMAVDEVLLESALHNQCCTVRLYEWSQATLSLGYFQSPHELPADPRWEKLPVVRRLSGGGAILHHHELTYSLAVPVTHPFAADPSAIYAKVHTAIIDRLAPLGVHLALREVVLPERNSAFLCFARGDAMDVVLGSHKVLGSAQRRRRGSILQHGSLVLKTSSFATEVLGLSELTHHDWRASDLKSILSANLPVLFGNVADENSLTAAESTRVEDLVARYRIRPGSQ